MEKQPTNQRDEQSPRVSEAAHWEVDPVCGMDVNVSEDSTEQTEHNGKTYYFCSADCRRQFEATPSDYGA